MPSKRAGGAGGRSSRRISKKKTKTEEEAPAGAPPDLTKTFTEGFWQGCKLDIHVPERILTLTLVTIPQTWAPFFTNLTRKTLKFDKTGMDLFHFEQMNVVNCRLYVASKCFGADYAGFGHLLEHILTRDLEKCLPSNVASKGITTECSTKYEFKLTQNTLKEIPRIVETFTNVDHFNNKLVVDYMREEVHRVHHEFLEKLFPLQPDHYLTYLLGNKAYVDAGHHKNFCSSCDGSDSDTAYWDSQQKLKKLFKQVYIPGNIYLLLESEDPSMVTAAMESFKASFKEVEEAQSREKVDLVPEQDPNTVPELSYSLSGKWVKANAAFIKSYRELNLTWTIGSSDPILYEFLATVLSCPCVRDGLVQVLRLLCPTIVYNVESAAIKHSSTVTRHFVLKICLYNNVAETDLVQVPLVVLEYLKGLEHWINSNKIQFEAQFDNFRKLVVVNKEFYYSEKDAWERLDSVVLNFAYDSHNRSGPDLNIDTLAWKLAVPRSLENSERLLKILKDEFLDSSNMAIIDIKLNKDEFQRISLEDFYLADLPLPAEVKFENHVELWPWLERLKASKGLGVAIDFDANFVNLLPIVGVTYGHVDHGGFPALTTQLVIDPCIVIQLHLEWCTDSNSSRLHPAMPDLLCEFLNFGYSTSYFSVWLTCYSRGPGTVTVSIVGLKKPAIDLLYVHVLPKLAYIRNKTCTEELMVGSTFLREYKAVAHNMCRSLSAAEDLINGMTLSHHIFGQDRLVGLDTLAKNKEEFYTYFKGVLDFKLHVAHLTVLGNIDMYQINGFAEINEMRARVFSCLGPQCNLCPPGHFGQRLQQQEISLEKLVLQPGNKTTAVIRKQNYLLKSPLQFFHRIYYLDSNFLDAQKQRKLSMGLLEQSFHIFCREQRIGYGTSVEYVHDETNPKNKRLLIFKIPFSLDVLALRRLYDSNYHSMDSIRDVLEDYLKPERFKKIAGSQSSKADQKEISIIAQKVLENLACRLTVEIYEHGGRVTTRGLKDNPYLIEWYSTDVRSAEVPALMKYRKSVGM